MNKEKTTTEEIKIYYNNIIENILSSENKDNFGESPTDKILCVFYIFHKTIRDFITIDVNNEFEYFTESDFLEHIDDGKRVFIYDNDSKNLTRITKENIGLVKNSIPLKSIKDELDFYQILCNIIKTNKKIVLEEYAVDEFVQKETDIEFEKWVRLMKTRLNLVLKLAYKRGYKKI